MQGLNNMNKLWCCNEGDELELFDSEETARKAYEIWCQKCEEEFNEEIFNQCYKPLSQYTKIWTMDDMNKYDI